MIELNPPDASIQISRSSLLVCFANPPSDALLKDMTALDSTSGVMILDKTDDDTIKYMIRMTGLYCPVESAVMFKNALVKAGLRAEIRNTPKPGYGYDSYYDSDSDAPLPDLVRTNLDMLTGVLIHQGRTDSYIHGVLAQIGFENLETHADELFKTDTSDSYNNGSKRLKDRAKGKKKSRRDAISATTVKKNEKRTAENTMIPSSMLLEIEEISTEGRIVRRRVNVPVLTSARVDSPEMVKKTEKIAVEEELMRMLRGSLKILRESKGKMA